MKKTLLTTLNAKYIHKNLALRWIYTTCPHQEDVILKEYTIKEDLNMIVQDIINMNVEVVCLSTYIWNIEEHKQIIQLLKQQKPTIHIIVGGPEVSFESFDLINLGVDAINIGEGEKNTWEYIMMLSNQECYEIKGMYTKAYPNKEYQKVDLNWLETFEPPYFLEMDLHELDKRYFYFETSRGCPYSCSYCLSSTDRQVRMFSMEYIMKILEKLKSSKVKQVKLLDRTFNCDRKRALQIARYMNEQCKNQIFQFEVVAETISDELFDFFTKECDVSRFRFEIGVQSFNPQTLTSVNRIQNNERLKQVIKAFREANCTMHVDLIGGLPFEGLNSFKQSFNELFALQASELQLGILKLLKGTKLKQQKDEYGFIYHEKAPYDVIQTNWLNQEELILLNACGDAVEKFYNSHFASDTINLLLKHQYISDPFTLFMELGKQYLTLPRPYQPHQLMNCFKEIFKDQNEQEIDAMILMSYYKRFKQKPHHFTKTYVSKELRSEILKYAHSLNIANLDELYRYSVVDLAFDQEVGYQLVLYNKNQQLPKRYFINQQLSECYELK